MELKAKLDLFKAWLHRQGAEVLATTNAYEILRFRARGAVHVVYSGRRGITWGSFSEECWAAFEKGENLDMGLTATQRTPGIQFRAALLERDGRDCFFCQSPIQNNDLTIEHLVGISKGGPNHLDNMVLAHQVCNQAVDNLPLRHKIKVHVNAVVAALMTKNIKIPT